MGQSKQFWLPFVNGRAWKGFELRNDAIGSGLCKFLACKIPYIFVKLNFWKMIMKQWLKILMEIIPLQVRSIFLPGVVNTYCWFPSNHTSFQWRRQKGQLNISIWNHSKDSVSPRRHLPHLFPHLLEDSSWWEGWLRCGVGWGFASAGGLGSSGWGKKSALSHHACLHQSKVFTESLSTEEFAKRSSDDMGGMKLSDGLREGDLGEKDKVRRSEG